MNDREQLVALLTELIAIPSVNPGLTDDPDIGGERRLAECLAGHLEPLGFALEWAPSPDAERPSIIGRLGGGGAHCRSLMIEAHLDTVGVENMLGVGRDPFKAEIVDGKLYGRGACDMKGAMAAALWALQDPELLRTIADHPERELIFTAAIDEERGLLGSRVLAAEGLRADQVLVLEPTQLHPVCAHKGAFWVDIELRGRSGHASDPEKGNNAIDAMRELLDFLQAHHSEYRASLEHPLLGVPTFCISQINGGQATNVIPDACRASIDCRALPEEDLPRIKQAWQEILNQLALRRKLGAAKLSISAACPAFATPVDGDLVKRLQAAALQEGLKTRPQGSAWCSDATSFAPGSGETVVFGPGSIEQAHTEDEYIQIDELVMGGKILKNFLHQWVAE